MSCSSTVCENVSEKTFTISSYLINSCGLSPNDAVSVSKKLRFKFKSPKKPDAVRKLLREYGLTDAHISRLVIKLPKVLLVRCPNKTLLPKLRFFRSISVPLPVLAQKLSANPCILMRSLENSIIPSYNFLKGLVGSAERVVRVFSRFPSAFGRCCSESISSNISMLRERGVPQSTIVLLSVQRLSLLVTVKKRLVACADRAVEMGFDVSKSAFILAMRVFNEMNKSSLQHKMEVYRRCGWSESDINAAFLKLPLCMSLSEKKITATMDFLVNTLGCKPGAIAQCPVLLNFSLEKRIKPRCLVAGILIEKGLLKNSQEELLKNSQEELLKNMRCVATLLKLSEEKFLKSYIVKYEKDIPELLDIYLGKVKSSPPGP
ncbi:hypothetical protein PHJA_002478200 [Phtheirospermum japonicum]|uniref:Uncharacterized protein n=1 Tax=Phtheirospermum japonicum TaxID=374723 RepID=A0A830D524_9LAMI|nr:hypothetical protein PHJA_002478200 [Phtheirospermum japonicum]